MKEVYLMKIFCTFNKDYEPLLKQTVEYAIENYGKDLNVDTLEEIELADKKLFPYSTEGKLISKERIVLSSETFEFLPYLDITQLYDNIYFKEIVNTIIHEMGHLTDYVSMPHLYDCVFNPKNKRYYLIALFWLEYLAESRTANLGLVNYVPYCKNFATESWDIQLYSENPKYFNRHNYYWLNKHLSYFIPRAENNLHKYLPLINIPNLKNHILDLIGELRRLKSMDYFDDITILYDLYKIQNKYYKIYLKK